MSRRIALFLTWAVAVTAAAAAFAAGIDGAWTAKVEGRQGRSMEMTFHFKADGHKLSGDVSTMGGKQEISDGSIEADTIKFKVKREVQGRSVTMSYEGKLAGDEIKFKQTVEGFDRPPREFTAKRAN